MHESNLDARAGKIMFVTHCVLNQNAKVRGIAVYGGAIKPVLELLLANDVGICQLPCPEMLYMGAMRWGQVRDQYDTPMFRRHAQALAQQTMDQAEEYRRSGYRLLGFVMMDGSPVCGLRRTPQPVASGDIWGGMTRYVPQQHFVDGSGVFCAALRTEARARRLDDVPFVSLPEVPDTGSFADALEAIRVLVEA